MNIFKNAKKKEKRTIVSNCLSCNEEFKPDQRNRKRGWGIFCSMSCAITWRNKKKNKSEKREEKLAKLGIK